MRITLRAARINANLTLGQAAEELGMHQDTLRNKERGLRPIKVKEYLSMCKLYNCSIDDIIVPKNIAESEIDESEDEEED